MASNSFVEEGGSLSNVTLRWMILECFRSKTGIEFDEGEMVALGFRYVPGKKGGKREIDITEPSQLFWQEHAHEALLSTPSLLARSLNFFKRKLIPWLHLDIIDTAGKIYDQLKLVAGWWLLEYVPTQLQSRTRAGWSVIRE